MIWKTRMVHVLQITDSVHVLQITDSVHVLQITDSVHVFPVQSSPVQSSPVQSVFYNMLQKKAYFDEIFTFYYIKQVDNILPLFVQL